MSTSEEIPWNENYKLGIDIIDTQHKKLFVLVNRLYGLDDYQNIKEELRDILNEFSEYMKTHFKDEEEYMLSIEYPELQEHKQLHQDLIEQLALVVKSSSKLNVLKTKMRVIAKRAIVDHIMHEDSKIKVFIESKKNTQLLDITNIEPKI